MSSGNQEFHSFTFILFKNVLLIFYRVHCHLCRGFLVQLHRHHYRKNTYQHNRNTPFSIITLFRKISDLALKNVNFPRESQSKDEGHPEGPSALPADRQSSDPYQQGVLCLGSKGMIRQTPHVIFFLHSCLVLKGISVHYTDNMHIPVHCSHCNTCTLYLFNDPQCFPGTH